MHQIPKAFCMGCLYTVRFKYFGYFQPLHFERYILSIGIHDTSFESFEAQELQSGSPVPPSGTLKPRSQNCDKSKSKPKLKPLETGEIHRRTEEVHCQGL